MFLFKASGETYAGVIKHERHAFHASPKDVAPDAFVLLSKNRDDCAMLEKQVQHVAKLARVRPAAPGEIERYWPGSQAHHAWGYVAELYWTRPLGRPFHLRDVPGLDAARYQTVQGFARLDPADATALLQHLIATNDAVLRSFVNDATRVDER